MENSALWFLFAIVLVLIGMIMWLIVVPSRRQKKSDDFKSVPKASENQKPFLEKVQAPSARVHTQKRQTLSAPSPMEMTPEEAEATTLPFQKPIAVRHESYKIKQYTDPIPETENIDVECFGYFKGTKVLIVEDNLINQKILMSVLRRSGMDVDVADNGKEALTFIGEKKRYDLVIMDISMPVMDGIKATRIIREYYPELDDMPIVTFTAFNLGPEIKEMFAAGANAYLTKPLNINQLYTVFTLFVGKMKDDVSFEHMLEMHGLDIVKGIENTDGDTLRYKAYLERFKHRYGMSAELFGQWVEREDFDRAGIELRKMYADAVHIGAYDLEQFLKDMQKYFIYHNEHLIGRQQLILKTKLQSLLDAIELYLSSYDENTSFSSSSSHQNLAPVNMK
jgi:CheY-like chemotaxis protein